MQDQGSQMNMLGLVPKIVSKFIIVTSGDRTVRNIEVLKQICELCMNKVKLNLNVDSLKLHISYAYPFSSLPVFQVINCHKLNSCIHVYIYIYIYTHTHTHMHTYTYTLVCKGKYEQTKKKNTYNLELQTGF
jgi:hypothetical protein